MQLDEAIKYLRNKGYNIICESNDRYIFKEDDEELFSEFIKEYDAYGDLGWGTTREVESYSDGVITFKDSFNNDGDNEADYDWFVDANELYADKKDVENFKAKFIKKSQKRTRNSEQLTAKEIAKLMRDNGISIQDIKDVFENN